MTLRESFLTVIYKKTGKIFTFNISTGKFMICLVLMFILNGLLAFFIFQYCTLSYKKGILVKKVDSMESEVGQLKEEIKEASYYKRWADNIIYRRLYAGSINGQGSSYLGSGISRGPLKLKPESTVIDNSLLGIDDFQLKGVNLEMDFELSFNLVNKDRGHGRISGYITIVGMNEEVIPPVYGVFPRINFEDGVPVDYQEGLSFSLKYLRPVKARINQPSIGPKLNKVMVMVYSTEGELILKQGFNIERMLEMELCS
jgi:hypothetical protein